MVERQQIALNKLGEWRNVDPTLYQIIQELQQKLNVFIGKEGANVQQQIVDDRAVAAGNVLLVNGLNSDIQLPDFEFIRIVGPTGGFSIGGLVPRSTRRTITLYNTVAQTMTLVNEDASSTSSRRLKTLTGGNVVLRAGAPSVASFIHDPSDHRWILISSN